jgi:hypothetical protein
MDVRSALTSVPDDSSDGDDDDNDGYKGNATGNSGMIGRDPSFAPVSLEICGRGHEESTMYGPTVGFADTSPLHLLLQLWDIVCDGIAPSLPSTLS